MSITELEKFLKWFLSEHQQYRTFEEENDDGNLETYYEPVDLDIEDELVRYFRQPNTDVDFSREFIRSVIGKD